MGMGTQTFDPGAMGLGAEFGVGQDMSSYLAALQSLQAQSLGVAGGANEVVGDTGGEVMYEEVDYGGEYECEFEC